ncbi:uncharacterized protein K02A2.6-like [Anneissia japonica]|uniref:uncharacterized protein K02A2.6-like n=1 Tax=Anneissia japonica TaxID=1529436 RepID=UPI00142589C0|nr:uncharacterized protein K02A2.6-like [Anneissia japonica]
MIIYWPGIDTDIEACINDCQFCQDHLPMNSKEPLIQKLKPSRPFQELAADFAHLNGQNYLILVCCLTDWPTVIAMGKDTTSHATISKLREVFMNTGVPNVFWCDGGSQFTSSSFKEFARNWQINIHYSSPYHQQSNGKAEATVKSMKKIIESVSRERRTPDSDLLAKALLHYKNTPSRKDGLSPAVKLFGTPIQDTLPAYHRSFKPQYLKTINDADRDLARGKRYEKDYFDLHTKQLAEIKVGNNISIYNHHTKRFDIYGQVVEIGPNRRYLIRTQGGRILVRNRRYIRKRTPSSIGVPNATPTHTPKRPERVARKPARYNDFV